MNGWSLDTYDSIDLRWSEVSNEWAADGNLEGVFLGAWQHLEILMGYNLLHMMV